MQQTVFDMDSMR